jgi:hypothetical protein
MKKVGLFALALALPGFSVTAHSATIQAPFADDYTINTFTGPAGVPALYGGLVFSSSDPNVLLLGGGANGPAGTIYSVGVTRDSNGHVTGTTGTPTVLSTAPYIDGGLAYAPNGTLFYTGYPVNQIGQITTGGAPARIDPAAASLNSVGSLNFVPTGFSNAGALVVLSYNNGSFGQQALTPAGGGTFAPGTFTPGSFSLTGGPEGFVYIHSGNADFSSNSMLVAEYGAGVVSAYEVDANGFPIAGTRRVFISGLSGAEVLRSTH